MSVQVVNGETELCHFVTVPTLPVNVNSPLVLPEHTLVAAPVTVPPTEVGSIDTVVAAEVAVEQAPLCTTALNCVATVKAPEVYVVAVLAISLQVLPSVELCHLVTVPVWPARVNTPLVLPLQTVVPPVTVPPTEVGSTVTVVEIELATRQLPLCTTALNWVVCVSGPEV